MNLYPDSNASQSDIKLYEDRAKHIHLKWCEQVVDIISDQIRSTSNTVIADIGSCYCQLYKELLRCKLTSDCTYLGFEYDDSFIALALKHFPDLSGSIAKYNADSDLIPSASIIVVSALINHIVRPLDFIARVAASDSDRAVLRLWLSTDTEFYIDKYSELAHPIYAHNLSCYSVIDTFIRAGWHVNVYPDRATYNSTPYLIHNEYYRQFFILDCKRIK